MTALAFALPVRVETGFDWPIWLTAIGTLVLATAAAWALHSLDDAKRTRHSRLVTDLSNRWDNERTTESLMLFSQHGPRGMVELAERTYRGQSVDTDDLELFYKLNRWPSLIEAIGVLWDEDAIEIGVIYKMWGPQILSGWRVWEEPVKKLRELDEYPITYRYFQRLAAALADEWAKDEAAAVSEDPHGSQSEEAAPAEPS